jgi:hypothetical protein
MLTLPKYDLPAQKWMEVEYPYPDSKHPAALQ